MLRTLHPLDGLVAAWDAVPQLREAHWRARIVSEAGAGYVRKAALRYALRPHRRIVVRNAQDPPDVPAAA